jgi:hypothetical protein
LLLDNITLHYLITLLVQELEQQPLDGCMLERQQPRDIEANSCILNDGNGDGDGYGYGYGYGYGDYDDGDGKDAK